MGSRKNRKDQVLLTDRRPHAATIMAPLPPTATRLLVVAADEGVPLVDVVGGRLGGRGARHSFRSRSLVGVGASCCCQIRDGTATSDDTHLTSGLLQAFHQFAREVDQGGTRPERPTPPRRSAVSSSYWNGSAITAGSRSQRSRWSTLAKQPARRRRRGARPGPSPAAGCTRGPPAACTAAPPAAACAPKWRGYARRHHGPAGTMRDLTFSPAWHMRGTP